MIKKKKVNASISSLCISPTESVQYQRGSQPEKLPPYATMSTSREAWNDIEKPLDQSKVHIMTNETTYAKSNLVNTNRLISMHRKCKTVLHKYLYSETWLLNTLAVHTN
jgi:hypothetical protein